MDGGDYFSGLIRRFSPPAVPLAVSSLLPDANTTTAAASAEFSAQGIRAYIFDVYGTLFTSASGDIGVLQKTAKEESCPPAALAEADARRIQEILAPFGNGLGKSLPELTRLFTAAVLAEHEKLRAKTAFPEIDVRKIWAGILRVDEKAAAEFALRFELAANPVYPMPGLEALLAKTAAAGIPLGMVSNAQFFTPLLFQAFLGKPPEKLGFLPELCVYSFREEEAKPSPRLFRKAAAALEALGIRPEETLYTGNDMLNDIWAAKQAGFRTALFAGDGRSLRLREGDPRCAGLKPDFIVKSLATLSAMR
ncbi:MAG: HAD family hydrolase [Spirochaetales bacterium]|jgi:putative hydrolase of the HAD superfamily|nr:HAD family hydrolase [Spirochaetales bacterium]